MKWYALRPRDPTDARWPLPDRPQVTLKAEDPADARRRFLQAYKSEPFGNPVSPVPDAGRGSFLGDEEALLVEETHTPETPKA
ncbi:hypothetical protein LKMONMHP_3787 [Methylobacterium organophilum]|uniref:Uncharacterized protein n=2 Tax=Methylobacterium organophilum TaxID=410 RepID=A0ABQ4TFU1_METOR|nr:hypothetical protein [Methylobacterium organophilum]UMY16120.1 hypothetical protein MMB17_15495 [Methylobacterium organophilum]GJE28912.1 hypothetical protein LKMONMHP_3787 [Methylobacterium organophilum]